MFLCVFGLTACSWATLRSASAMERFVSTVYLGNLELVSDQRENRRADFSWSILFEFFCTAFTHSSHKLENVSAIVYYGIIKLKGQCICYQKYTLPTMRQRS